MRDWRRYVAERLPLAARAEKRAEIVEEVAQQLEEAEQDAIAAGHAAEQAAEVAARQVPDWALLAREIDAELPFSRPEPPLGAHGESWRDGVRLDVRYATRAVGRRPGVATLAIAASALAIAGNALVFGVVDSVLRAPLPYRDADRLVAIETRNARQPELEPAASGQDYRDLAPRLREVPLTAAVSPAWNMALQRPEGSERIQVLFVSANLLPMLGVAPELGRGFDASEDQIGRPAPVAVLSHSLWRRSFAGDPAVAGKPIVLDGRVGTVIGVLPEGFRYLGVTPGSVFADVDLLLPLAANPIVDAGRSVRAFSVVGRLAPSSSLAAASAELRSVWAGLVAEHPSTNAGFEVALRPLKEQVVGRSRYPLLALMAMAVVLMLVAVANVASILLARAAARQKEIAVRIALGASPARVVRQLMAESALLATAGGALGWVLARAVLGAVVAISPAELPRKAEIGLGLPAAAFTLSLVLAVAMAGGLLPALALQRRDLRQVLKLGGRGSTAWPGRAPLGRGGRGGARHDPAGRGRTARAQPREGAGDRSRLPHRRAVHDLDPGPSRPHRAGAAPCALSRRRGASAGAARRPRRRRHEPFAAARQQPRQPPADRRPQLSARPAAGRPAPRGHRQLLHDDGHSAASRSALRP